jgi:ketosteroid isomerase-like protein
MTRNWSALVVTLFVLAALIGSARAQDVKEQLKKLETDRAAAVVKGDVATLDKQTADDYVLISMNGRMSDKSQMLDGFKSGQSKLTSNDLSDLKVRVYGDAAVVTGKADVKGTLGGQDATGQVLFTRVYVKKGGHWQSVSFQQTRISNP